MDSGDAHLMHELQRGLAERKQLLQQQLEQVAALKAERAAELQRLERLHANRQSVIDAEFEGVAGGRDRAGDEKEDVHAADAKAKDRERRRMKLARQQLDAALGDFNRVITALQVAKEALAKKRAAADIAKKRYKSLVAMMKELVEMSEAVESGGVAAARDSLLGSASYAESGTIGLGEEEEEYDSEEGTQ